MNTVTLELTPGEFNALVGLLDAGVKTVGIRALEDDTVSLTKKLKKATEQDTAETETPEE